MYLVINKCVTAVKVSNFSGHYLRDRSTLDIGVLGYIAIVQHKEHSPEVFHIPPGTPCIIYIYIHTHTLYALYYCPNTTRVTHFKIHSQYFPNKISWLALQMEEDCGSVNENEF